MADQQSPPVQQPSQARGDKPTSGDSTGVATRRPGRTLAVWGGAAALVLVAGGVAIGTVNATVYSPEAQVERYLEALADGDGAVALAMARGGGSSAGQGADGQDTAGQDTGGQDTGDAGLAPGMATTLLDGAPLAAGFSALQDVTVSRGEESDHGVEVLVDYRVDGQEHATRFRVEHLGRDWLFFDRWRMAPVSLSTVRVASDLWPAEAAGQQWAGTVNGVEVTLTGDRSPAQDFAALPPSAVEASASSTYLEAAATRTIVDGADPSQPLPLVLDLQYTEEVAAEANRQLDEYLAQCTGQQVLHPAGCPMGYDTVNRIPPDSITWSIAPDPAVEIAPLPDATEATEGTDVTTVAPVRTGARLALEEIDLVTGERRRTDHEEQIEIAADLQVGPESLRYAPQAP